MLLPGELQVRIGLVDDTLVPLLDQADKSLPKSTSSGKQVENMSLLDVPLFHYIYFLLFFTNLLFEMFVFAVLYSFAPESLYKLCHLCLLFYSWSKEEREAGQASSQTEGVKTPLGSLEILNASPVLLVECWMIERL